MKKLLFVFLAIVLMSSECDLCLSVDIEDLIDVEKPKELIFVIPNWDMLREDNWSTNIDSVSKILEARVVIYSDEGNEWNLHSDYVAFEGNVITITAPVYCQNQQYDFDNRPRGRFYITNYVK